MDLQIFTDDALEIVKLGEMDPQETVKYYKEHGKDDVATVKAIIGAYVAEFLIAAQGVGVALDLTYGTIRNIPAALMMLYNNQFRAGFVDSRNKIVTCRTLAAYMNLLIINNFDNVAIEAKKYANREHKPRPDRWADYMVLRLDHKKNSDMLPYVWEGAKDAEDEKPSIILTAADEARAALAAGADDTGGDKAGEDGRFTIEVAPLVEGYERLTGDKLTDEGLADMTIFHMKAPKQEPEDAAKEKAPAEEEKKLILK